MDKHIAYDDALDQAHGKGLEGIDTQILEYPTKENGGLTIFKATVWGTEGRYSATGDSSPRDETVQGAVRKHWIRMAETRAKGRALRDYINKGKDPELTDA